MSADRVAVASPRIRNQPISRIVYRWAMALKMFSGVFREA